jgi:D-alanyl-D-alanine carboxypeptidase/D-alanyl-D-alanine-endopeptidase (penicillin-binding protein 4)
MRIFMAQMLSVFIGLAFSLPAVAFDKETLDKKLIGRASFDHGVVFTRISDGKVLYESHADKLLSPASVTKVITSAASLSYFGPAYSFKTPIFYTGTFSKGRISGDLIIKGNGDPFLVSEILWQTAIDLRHMGVRSIAGNLVIDQSLFDGEVRDESRQNSAKTSSHAYDAPISAFAVNFNTIQAAVASTVKGAQALISVSPFPMNTVALNGRVMTQNGSGSDISASRSTRSNGDVALTLSGSIGEDFGIQKIYRSAGNPSVSASDYLRGFLKDAGVQINGKIGVIASVPKNATPLYQIQGYEMRRIVSGLNTFSNNFIADMLTKRLGAGFASTPADLAQSGTLDHGVKVLNKFLKEDVSIKSDFTILNGSGLSTENRFSARQIAQVLNWMEKQAELFPDFLGSLPANGWDGTLRKRLKKDDALAGMIRAKTGTLTEPIVVAGMAGYFRDPKEGWVSFVMIGNGRSGQGQPGLLDVRKIQDDALKYLLQR